MAEGTLVGHWENLAEAQKLTQDLKLRGVVQEIINTGEVIPRLPVRRVIGKQLSYVREKTLPEGAVMEAHGQIGFSANVEYDEVFVALKVIADQRKLHHQEAMNYPSLNDYRAQKDREMAKGLTITAERQIVYGSTANSAMEFDGLHALSITNGVSGKTNIRQNGALSLANVRKLVRETRLREGDRRSAFWLVPDVIADRIDAYPQEAGLTTNTFGQVSFNINQIGERVTMLAGFPIVRSTYLGAETDNTGVTSGVRAASAAGTRYSMFLVAPGQVEDGGLALCLGGQSADVSSVFMREDLGALQDYLATGARMFAFTALALGRSGALGRIVDISDAALVA